MIRREPAGAAIDGLESLRMNRETLIELLEARQALEVSNASIAAVKRKDEDVAAFRKLMVEMERSVGVAFEGERTDVLFHRLLARATRNAIMLRLFESIAGQLERAIHDLRRVKNLCEPRDRVGRCGPCRRTHEGASAACRNDSDEVRVAGASGNINHTHLLHALRTVIERITTICSYFRARVLKWRLARK